MTFPSGSGSGTNNMGPFLVSNTASVSDDTAADLGIGPTNTGRTISATQTALSATVAARNTQQGVAAISNTASISIAGVPAGQLAVNRWQ